MGAGKWGTAQCVQNEVQVSSDESNDSSLRRHNWVVHDDEWAFHRSMHRRVTVAIPPCLPIPHLLFLYRWPHRCLRAGERNTDTRTAVLAKSYQNDQYLSHFRVIPQKHENLVSEPLIDEPVAAPQNEDPKREIRPKHRLKVMSRSLFKSHKRDLASGSPPFCWIPL